MLNKMTMTLVLGACLAICGTASAAPDFSAQMNTLATTNVLGDPIFIFFAPATADLNENGVLDATEFALLEAQMDGAFAYSPAVNSAYNANLAAVTSVTDTTLASLLTQPKFNDLLSLLAGYQTLGGEKNYAVLNVVVSLANRYFGKPFTHSPGQYSSVDQCEPCGDADGDGVKNLLEELAAADEAAAVAAALASGTTAAGADTLGGCTFKFDAEPGPVESRHWFFNPANGHVYFVGGDSDDFGTNVFGLMFPDQIAGFAAAFTINGTALAGVNSVRINDAAENTFIAGLRTQDVSVDAGVQLPRGWTGANDAVTEGTWKWGDGTTFWIGAAGGTAQGGLYVNWGSGVGSGEPNNSGEEDYQEINFGSGGWNDNAVDAQRGVILELADTYTDTNADGIPDGWTDNNNDGLPDFLVGGTLNIIVAGGDPTVKVGTTLQLSATSEAGDQYTWTSSDTSIATVEPSGGTVDVTGVSEGVVTITAEVTGVAKGLGASNSVQITVIPSQWYDLCDSDDLLMTQFSVFADLLLDEPDNELGSGDGIPDKWQVYLLAYALCKGGSGVPAEATEAFNANLDALAGALPSATTYSAFIANIMSQADEIEALAVKFETNPCDNAFAGLGIASLATLLHDVAATLGSDLADLAALPVLMNEGYTGSAIAALCTTSTEMGLTLNAALEGATDIQDDFDDILTAIGGIAANLGACPDGVAADAAGIYGALTSMGGTVPSVAWPTWTAAVDPAKTAGQPFAGTTIYGAGDYNGDGLTNAEVAAIVIGEGGTDEEQMANFLAGATGDFGPFWAGNPGLPLGIAVLGGLLGALAVGGAVSIRRKK